MADGVAGKSGNRGHRARLHLTTTQIKFASFGTVTLVVEEVVDDADHGRPLCS